MVRAGRSSMTPVPVYSVAEVRALLRSGQRAVVLCKRSLPPQYYKTAEKILPRIPTCWQSRQQDTLARHSCLPCSKTFQQSWIQ
jgi:hypothetical protein